MRRDRDRARILFRQLRPSQRVAAITCGRAMPSFVGQGRALVGGAGPRPASPLCVQTFTPIYLPTATAVIPKRSEGSAFPALWPLSPAPRPLSAVPCSYGLIELYNFATSAPLSARSHSATSSMLPLKNRPVNTGLSPIVNNPVLFGVPPTASTLASFPSQ
jgi:hypothetical protein